ncbi:alpha/beta fold hydrolase [Mesorhizobium sp. M0204]|uniref:thioesterase II family protein n=1 Tax=unclassified Mesorhizobium TaxID=325217 RepID=UPI00333AB1EC
MEARLDRSGLLVARAASARQALRRVVAIPHAGAGPNTVANWAAAVDQATEMVFVRLPGRETRFCELPIADADEAGREVAGAVGSLPPRPTVLLGHSMGSLVAYLAACRLTRTGFAHLAGLIVSGLHPPHTDGLCPRVAGMPDTEFLAVLERLGGMPPGVSDNGELIDLLLPLIRADFRLVEDYRHEHVDPLSVPIVLISGDQDCLAPPHAAHGWDGYTDAGFHSLTHDGDHFAVMDPRGTWLDAVSTALALIWGSRERSEASREANANCNTDL